MGLHRLAVAGALAAFLVFAASTSAALGYGPLWNCTAPCEIGYQIDDSFPESEKQRIRVQAAAWSAAPEVELVERFGGKVKLESCETRPRDTPCGFVTVIDYNNGGDHFDIQRVTIVIDVATWAGWEGLDFVYCHELSHALGFDDGAPSQEGCPTLDHFALLEVMYPLGGSRRR